MSRCFPFPPPGYEKEIRADESDLIKEKHKEKKHRKDKKDKEKKEGKEKKDRERSKDKHKERKEKSEKHKDREEKKAAVLPHVRDTEKLVTNTSQNHSNGDSRFVQDLARRIKDGDAAMGSQSEQKTKIHDQRNAGLTGKVIYPLQETNYRRDDDDDDKRIHPQRSVAVAKGSETGVARESYGTDQKRDVEKRIQGNHRYMESVIKSDKSRDKEGLKKSESKDRDSSKEKKEVKPEAMNKIGNEKPKCIEGGARLKDSLDIRNNKPPDVSRPNHKNNMGDGNIGKRKDHERNGFLYENGSRPNKLPKLVASPVSSSAIENGRKLGSNRIEMKTLPEPVAELQGAALKPDAKKHRVNGVIDSQESKVGPPTAKVREKGEASVKQPHPDLKYMNRLLDIPKREEIDLFDDEEWLHGDLSVKLKKTRRECDVSDETERVWDRAFRIESADIVALPYVVPF